MNSNDNEIVIIFEAKVVFVLSDEEGVEFDNGQGRIQLTENAVFIIPKFGETLLVSYRDILKIQEKDYRLHIQFKTKEILTISDLGYKYEDFLRIFHRLRNEILIKDLLINESIRKSGIKAEFTFTNEGEEEIQNETCEIRLLDTAIVIIPDKSEVKRIPYSYISSIKAENYKIDIICEFEDKYTFSMMGYKYDPVVNTLSDVINELNIELQSTIKELLPKEGPLIIRRVSRFMKEGMAAKKSDIDKISPKIWGELEKRLELAGIKDEYNHLKSISQKSKLCIGFKRGLLGDLTGEYIWFLIPIYNITSKEYGNAFAMEAGTISEEEVVKGKATYFFRMMERNKYSNIENIDELHKKADEFIRTINRCMIEINLRREPIYLSDEKINEPRYEKYQFAIEKIPSLRLLRKLFIGRVIHGSEGQWEEDVKNLLKFNINSRDDNEKWKKGD